MSSKEIGIEEARKTLGHLALEVQRTGQPIILTRGNSRTPVARIAPLEDTMTATITAEHIHRLAGAAFSDLPVLALDTDGEIEVFPASTAASRGARIIYDADRLQEYTDGDLDDTLAETLAADLNAELRSEDTGS